MQGYLDKEKRSIRDHSVFDGLAVDDRAKFAALFLHPQFHLLTLTDGQNKAHVIFEEWQVGFVFHLVNFTKMTTRTMTEDLIMERVLPYCKYRGLSFIQASVERAGMARKLSKLGFKPFSNNIYRKDIDHVL